MSTERGYRCVDHAPPIDSEPLYMSVDDLRECHEDREFLIQVLRRFGNVDNDTKITSATRFLCQHVYCALVIWEENNPEVHSLPAPPGRPG